MKLVHWFNPLVLWLWDNKEYVLKQDDDNILRPGDRFGFEVFYPEYGGIPEEIAEHLNDKHMLILNKYTVFYLRHYSEKQKFCQLMCDELSNSTVLFEDVLELVKE